MINSSTVEYYRNYCGVYIAKYIQNKNAQDTRFNYILGFIVICIILATIALSAPLFAQNDLGDTALAVSPPEKNITYNNSTFQKEIKEKYKGSAVTFPTEGIAHIKKVKYINSKPIKLNIVEISTKANPYLKITPKTAGTRLNSKATVRKIAQNNNAIVAINGGFFKPQTGVPLGALMIDKQVLAGTIYNRVGIAIFEDNLKEPFKMANIVFDIKAKTDNFEIVIDNINQPRMLQTYMLLYTSKWGKTVSAAPKSGYNLVIRNKKPIKISANEVTLEQDDIVLQGNKEIISKLARDGEINIEIKLQDSLQNATHIISAGPYLVKNSEIYVDTKAQKLQAISGKNPRSAIGYTKDYNLIIVTVDGREEHSVGMTLSELAKLMKGLNCTNAMNFDGGSSSALYVKGKIANSAVNKEGIAVSNALVVIEDKVQLASY